MNLLWITPERNASEDRARLRGISVEIATGPSSALRLCRSQDFDAVVINTPSPDWSAGELLEQIHAIDSSVPVMIRDESPSLSEAVRLTKLGAFHVIASDAEAGELMACVRAAVDYSRAYRASTANAKSAVQSILVGRSRAMREVFDIIELVGPRRCTVLISGETGTGKELVARALHQASPRANLPLVAVNCTALPENLLEAELFGHVRGAFTGAMNQRTGRFEQAHRGTLFLDEIADLPLELQGKLLRVLQEREFQRLGSSETIRVDVRVIAACNVNLAERVRAGRFREDLYYRLNVVLIELPPLRDRAEDIPLLAQHFVAKICAREDLPLKRLSDETLDRLVEFAWPGNVRQLENAVEGAAILSGDRDVLYPSDFRLGASAAPVSPAPAVISVPDHGLDFEKTVGRIELHILEQALRKTNGNKKRAADMLRLKRTTLSAKLKSLEALAG
jgi:DNA-binding NtrC family response regulator